MIILKKAKMTQKTKRTIKMAGQVLNLKIEHMRKDRQAIDEMERLLENEGYEWIPAKQEWAKMTAPLPLLHFRHFVVMTTEAEADVIVMLLQAGAEALGANVKMVEKIDTVDDEGVLSHLLMEMTE